MYGLSARPGLVTSALVLCVGVWWLAGIALQSGGGNPDLHELSATAAVVVILAQYVLIALLPAPATVASRSGALNILSSLFPLWPLLALLWLTSRLSLTVLFFSQIVALLIAFTMILAARLLAGKIHDAELQQLATVAASVVFASGVWLMRAPLVAWLAS